MKSMKKQVDDKGYPLNFDPSNYYKEKEIFVPLNNVSYIFPDYYLASSHGRVINTKNNTSVPQVLIPERNRYIKISIRDIYGSFLAFGAHQIIAAAFVKCDLNIPFSKLSVNHIDGVKWHNEPYNLEWVTIRENIMHAYRTHLKDDCNGETNVNARLTNDQYRQICELTQQGYLAYEINNIMNLGYDITNIVQKIRNGKSELFISKDYDFSNIKRNDYKKFSEEQVRFICTCLQNNPEMKYIDIIRSLGFNIEEMNSAQIKKLRDTISTIKRRVSYIEIGNEYNF